MIEKADLRKKYLDLRNELTEPQVREKSEQIFRQLSKTDIWEYSYYMLYYPIADKKEPELQMMISQLWNLGKKVYLPKIQGDEMNAVQYSSETILQVNKLGVEEPAGNVIIQPEQIEVFIIPMIICDQYGNRVGYGKGYYDKYLANASSTALKVGVNFFEPLQEEIPTEETDIKLDYCFTPESIVSFGTRS